MARLFDDAASQKIVAASAVVAAVPLTMACWFNSDSDTPNQVAIALADSSVENHWFWLYVENAVGGDRIEALVQAGGATAAAITSTTVTRNVWHHGAVVFSAVDARAAYLDGGGKGTDVNSRTPAGLDRTSIGAVERATPGVYFSGRIAEAAIWNVALSDAEVAVLAEGFSPLFVRPQNLVFHAPLIQEILDVVGGVPLTNNGSTVAEHPPIFYPAADAAAAFGPQVYAVPPKVIGY